MYLSLDASTTSTGYAIYDDVVLIKRGTIRPCEKNPLDRIASIHKELKTFFKRFKITHVFIEDVPLSSTINKRVAENLLILQGCVYGLCIEYGSKFIQLEPSNWRRLVGLNSSRRRDEQKESAINMVNEKFGFDYKWVDSKYDSSHGDSDVCEAILIGLAGMSKTI